MHKTLFAARDREQRTSALLEAANAVFAERGYDAATTREIAERAGCAEGLIHRYFAGKRGLFLAILEHKGSLVADEFGATLRDTDSLQEDIEQILLHDLDGKWERRDFMRVCISEAAIDPEVGAAIRDRIHAKHVELIADRLRRHQEAGRIRRDVDIEAIAYAVSAIGFSGGFMNRIVFGRSREEIAPRIIEAAAALARGIATTEEGA
jgi:AcrR family transcriptional regulator